MFYRKGIAAEEAARRKERAVFDRFCTLDAEEADAENDGADERVARLVSGSGKTGNVLYGTGVENCDFSDGSLRAGIRMNVYVTDGGNVPEVPNPTDPPKDLAVLSYEDGGVKKRTIFYVSGIGTVYVYDETNKVFLFTMKSFSDMPKTTFFYDKDGNAELIVSSADGVFSYDYSKKYSTLYAGAASSICRAFGERLFFVEPPYTVRYCAPLSEADYEDSADEGGYIEFPSGEGKIVALESLGEKLYVFRERGIFSLSALGAARDFVAKKAEYGGGEIFTGSVGRCGERIWFLAENGVYAFDGKKAERVCENLSVKPIGTGQVCEQAAYGGKFFLRFKDSKGKEKLIVGDDETGLGYFSSSSARAFSVTEQGLLCFADGKIQKAAIAEADGGSLPTGSEVLFVAENADFGIPGRKLFRKLSVKGSGTCEAEIGNGETSKTFALSFTCGRAEVKPLLKGDSFTLKFRLGMDGRVTGGEAEFSVYG